MLANKEHNERTLMLVGRAVGAAHSIHSTDELLSGGLAFGSKIDRNQACLWHDARGSHPDLPTRPLHCVGNLASRLSTRLHSFRHAAAEFYAFLSGLAMRGRVLASTRN